MNPGTNPSFFRYVLIASALAIVICLIFPKSLFIVIAVLVIGLIGFALMEINMEPDYSKTDKESFEDALRKRRESAVTTRFNARRIADYLNGIVIGQKQVIDDIAMAVERGGRRQKKKPIASILLVGPPGTGKTTIASVLSKALFGEDEERFTKIDCADKLGYRASTLTGVTAGYRVGHGTTGEGSLTMHLDDMDGQTVILLDELEKGITLQEPQLANILHPLLEEGELVDANTNKPSYAANSVIIATTNIEWEQFEELAEQHEARKLKRHCRRVLKKYWPDSFVDRFSHILVMKALSDDALYQIATNEILKLAREFGVEIVDTETIDSNGESIRVEGIHGEVIAEAIFNAEQADEHSVRPLITEIEGEIGDALDTAAYDDKAKKVRLKVIDDEISVKILEYRDAHA